MLRVPYGQEFLVLVPELFVVLGYLLVCELVGVGISGLCGGRARLAALGNGHLD